MAGLDRKLKQLTEVIGDQCQLAYDVDQDRWVVHTCLDRQLRGCGRSAEDAIDAAIRKVSIPAMVGG